MNSLPLSQSKPRMGKGRVCSTSFTCCKIPCSPLPHTARCSVQQVAISTKLTVLAYMPAVVSPQCATVSDSRNPGLVSFHCSVFMGMYLRKRVPGLVVDLPRPLYFMRSGLSSLSMVAGDILNRF